MGKLGKKARKFAKKNLQSVHKRNRKMNSMFKKKASKKYKKDFNEDPIEDATELSNVRKTKVNQLENASLDSIFTEYDSDTVEDDSNSDGYLSEDSSLNVVQSDGDNYLEDNCCGTALSVQNKEIYMELARNTKKLNRLKEKDPGFSKFLESYDKELEQFRNKIYADEDEMDNDGMQPVDGDIVNNKECKFFTISAVNSWCQLVTEQQSVSALTSLLNGYRTACHYGVEPSGVHSAEAYHRIQDSETFCKILIFMLNEADNLFRGLLGISSSNSRKEKVVEAKNSSKWNTLKPLIKSYLRSTLFLLNQATDVEILTFSLTRVRASMTFFVAFPILLHRLIKTAVHLWATGGGTLSSHAFLIIRDLASGVSSNWFDTCFIKTYKSFVSHCQIVEPAQLKHMEYLRNSFVELCSVDVQKSFSKAMVSIHQLGKILHQGLQTKKKEAVKNICSWQYISCIDIWVMFISANIRDYDLQPLLFMITQIINGVALLFPGPRYLPLRIKCIQWLNQLSSSSGVFIPVASLVLDVLEHKIGKDGEKSEKAFRFSTSIKLPKHWLKSRNFQELCVFSTIELLSTHFAQWSHHISFPDLAIIPLICLKKFHETTTTESFKRPVKRFIDQVEQNVQFVQKKRDEMPFSPKDQQSVESFLQLEKFSGNTPFMQYYKSIMDKAAARNIALNKKFPGAEYIPNKREKVEADMTKAESDGGHTEKTIASLSRNGS